MIFLLVTIVNHPIPVSAKTNDLGPIAFWSFNNVKNNTVPDDSGDNLTGILVNTTVVSGLTKQALYFNGKNSYMQVNDSNLLHFSNMSISIWFKPLPFTNMARLIGKGSNSTESFGIFLMHGLEGYGIYTFINKAINGGYPYITATSEWHNIVFVYDQLGYFTYLDGKIIDNSPKTGYPLMVNNTEPLILGIEKNPDGFAYPFNGSMDQVRIYNRAIASNEALALYMSDRPATSPQTLTSQGSLPVLTGPGMITISTTKTTSNTNNIFTTKLINQVVTLSTYSLVGVSFIIGTFTLAYFIRERKNYKKEGKSISLNEFIRKFPKRSNRRKEIEILSDKTLRDLEIIIEENK